MFHISISICFWQALYMGGRVGSLRSRVSVTFDAKGEAHCQFSSFQWFLGCFCGPNMDQLDQFWCRYDGMLFLFLLFVGEGFGEYFLVTVYIYIHIYTFLMGKILGFADWKQPLQPPKTPKQTFQSTSRSLCAPAFLLTLKSLCWW